MNEDKVAEAVNKLRRALYIGMIVYTIFWGLVIALIHLVMVPAIKGG